MILATYAILICWAIAFVFARAAVVQGGDKNGRVGGTNESSAKVLVFLTFLTFAIFMGFRYISAEVNDEYVYRNRVLAMVDVSLGSALSGEKEIINVLLNWVTAQIFPGESQWIIVTYSLITFGAFIYCIYSFCDNFEFGISLLILLNIVNVCFNTTQQMAAVAVSMIGIPFVYKQKFIKYAIVIAIATMIHISAIILIAVYFIANMKPWSTKFIGVAAGFVVVMAVFNQIAPNFFNSLGVLEEYGSSYGDGVKTITVLVAFVPLGFAFYMKRYFPSDDEQLNCGINMSLVYAMIYLVSTQNKYVARCAMYIQPYIIVLYTRAMSYLKKENMSTLAYFVLYFGYGATFIYFTKEERYRFVSPFSLLF